MPFTSEMKEQFLNNFGNGNQATPIFGEGGDMGEEEAIPLVEDNEPEPDVEINPGDVDTNPDLDDDIVDGPGPYFKESYEIDTEDTKDLGGMCG